MVPVFEVKKEVPIYSQFFRRMLPHISELERMKNELRRSQRLLPAFSQAGQAVQRARTPAEVYRTVGEEVVRLGFNAVVFSLAPDRASLTISHATFEPALLKAAAKLTGLSLQDYTMRLTPGGFYQRIMAEGQTIFTGRNRTAEVIDEGLPEPLRPLVSQLAAMAGIEQGITARLTVGGEAHGVLAILGTGLTEAEAPTVTAFASQTAIALENARAEETLRKSEEKYRSLYESSRDGIVSADMKGQILDVNQAYLDMLGYSKDELRKLAYQQLTPLKWHESDADIIKNQVLARGYSNVFEKEFIRKDGTIFPISIRVWLMKDEQEQPVGTWGIVRDITGHKRVEEELRKGEERYRAFIVATAQVVWTTNAGGEVVVDLPLWRELTGQSEEAIKGLGWIEAVHPDDRERAAQAWIKAVEAKSPYENEYRVRKYDGSYPLFFARGVPVLEADGSIREWVGTCTDITERKRTEAELKKHREHLSDLVEERTAELKRTNETLETEITGRKRAEEASKENSVFVSTLLNTIPVPVFYKDAEGRYIGFNKSFEEFFGQTQQELAGKSVFEIAPRQLAEVYHAKDLELLQHSGSQVYDSQVEDVRGVVRDVVFHKAAFTDPDGRVRGLVGAILDITERKRGEEALRESEETFRTHVENSFDVIFTLDKEGTFVFVSPAWERHFGYPVSDATGNSFAPFVHPDDVAPCVEYLMRVLNTRQSETSPAFRVKRADGDWRWFVVNGTPYVDVKGELQFIGVGRDITDQRKAEESLRESEARYRTLFQGTVDGILIADIETRIFRYANPAVCRLLGYSEAELTTMCMADIHPKDDLPWVVAEFEAQVRGDKTLSSGVPCLRKDGAIVYADVNAVGMSIDGRVCNVGFFRDITERKRGEEALRASQQIIEGILNAIPVRVFWKDKNLVYLGCNAVLARDAGFADPKDVIGKDDYQMGWREQAELYRGDDREVIESGGSKFLIEEPLTTPEGNIITLLTSKVPLRSSKGEITGILGTYMDITERKRVEKALAHKTMLLEAHVQTSISGILAVDNFGHTVFFNKRFGELWRIPQHILDEKNYAKMLEYALTQVKDPAEFSCKVAYLHEHKDEKCSDEIEFADGRCFDRYSSPLLGGCPRTPVFPG